MDTETVSLLMRNANKDATYEFNRHNYGRKRSAEELLLMAVLLDAQERIQGVVTPGLERKRSDACKRKDIAWLESEDRDWPMAFVPICEMLELDPSWVRKQILSKRKVV